MKHFRDDCTADHQTFGGKCLNCGATETPDHGRTYRVYVDIIAKDENEAITKAASLMNVLNFQVEKLSIPEEVKP